MKMAIFKVWIEIMFTINLTGIASMFSQSTFSKKRGLCIDLMIVLALLVMSFGVKAQTNEYSEFDYFALLAQLSEEGNAAKNVSIASVSTIEYAGDDITAKNVSTSSSPTTEYGEYDYSTMIANYVADEITAQFVPLTSGLMGESHDINTGSLTFRHVDVSLPGNSHLPVQFARTYSGSISGDINADYPALASWEVDLPFVVMRVVEDQSTDVDFCGNAGSVLNKDSINRNNSIGIKMNVPGQGMKSFSINSTNVPGIGSGVTFKTIDFWLVKCGLDLVGDSGKGFTVTAPNGDTYKLNKILHRYAGMFKNDIDDYTEYNNLYFMVTEVTDVNGNWVKYEYNDYGVTKIHSNDLRQIDILYDGMFINKVTANGREWSYEYNNATPIIWGIGYTHTLKKVTLPDNTFWDIGIGRRETSTFCHSIYYETPITYTSTMKHPNGTLATFERQIVNHRVKDPIPISSYFGSSTSVPGNNFVFTHTPCSYGFPFNWQFSTLSLTQKTIEKADGEPLVWTYDYHDLPTGWIVGDEISEVTGELTTQFSFNTSEEGISAVVMRTVIDPEGHKTITYINNVQAGTEEGNVTKIENYDSATSTTPVQTTYFDSFTNIELDRFNPYAVRFPTVPQWRKSVPSKVSIVQNTDTYTTETTFDTDVNSLTYSYGLSIQQTTSSNTHEKVRVYDTKYAHNLTKWILGLVDNTILNGTTINDYEYDAFGRMENEKVFGRERATYTYYTDDTTDGQYLGTVKTITNANDETVELLDWKRGKPQQIKRPDGVSSYRTVDNNGWVTQTKDFKGTCTDYQYTDAGWLKLIDPCDNKWANTVITYALATGSEGLTGVFEGMLKQTTTRGGYKKVSYLDHFYQPVLTHEQDTNDALSLRYTRAEFNSDGAVLYQSKPDDSHTTPYGVHSSYDSLGRVTSVNDNTLSGSITYLYQSGNKVQVNDNEGNVTSTTYQSYGSPDQSAATKIASPEGVTTNMVYDIFGKVVSIEQGGITESRVYDGYQQLCKTVRPDTGRVAYDYNDIGQMAWSATGASVDNSTSVCDTTVAATDKITYSFNNLGLMETVVFGDASPTQSYIYDLNNNLKTLTADTVSHSYTYNSANLLENETLTLPGKSYTIDYEYNALGHAVSLTYPDGDVVTYAPNSLGQPTQVIRDARSATEGAYTYVNGASHYPSGSINTFTYGNGFVHKTVLNNSNLPTNVKDATADVTVLNYAYTYDSNLNIKSITDGVNSSFSLTSLGYDGLDRLTSTAGNVDMGSSAISYDGVGNITSYSSKEREFDYHYNTSNVLTKVDIPSGNSSLPYKDFSYDGRGNVTDNGLMIFDYNLANQMVTAGAGKTFLYDGHNRRVKKTSVTTDGTKTDYSLYSQNGTLLYRETDAGGINYIYLGSRLVAKDGVIPDNAGNQHFRPFGESIEGEIDDAGYTGHKFDKDLGLSYMQARYYDPVIGRFYSNDPVGYSPNNPVGSFNRYSYVNNNPYKYTDPTGMCFWDACILEAYVAVGVATAVATGVTIAVVAMVDTFDKIDQLNESAAPELPDGLVGDQGDDRAGQSRGKRHNSGPLTPENGGTGSPDGDFEKLTGGTGKPAEGRKEGTITGANGITIRPGKEGEGPRIDIPANGEKPPETLHYDK
jgi:RHS repeat-associated protein